MANKIDLPSKVSRILSSYHRFSITAVFQLDTMAQYIVYLH